MPPVSDEIRRVTEAVVRDFRPTRIILFGSQAYGAPRPDSDVDLLVILPFDGSPVAMMSAMLASAYRVMKEPFAVEFHPRRPLAAGDQPDPVMKEALERGVVIYERAA